MRRVALAVLCTLTLARGQQQDDSYWQPEVRRALPVEKPAASPSPAREIPTAPAVPFDNPAWMEKVAPSPAKEIPTAPAVPAEPQVSDQPQAPTEPKAPPRARVPKPSNPPPAPTPAARPPGPEPGFTPYRPPKGTVQVSPTPEGGAPPTAAPDEGDSIRIGPGSSDPQAAAQNDLDRANGIYARKMYDFAIVEYEKFLIAHPNAPGRDTAMFRLGECHRMLGNEAAARAAYEKLLMSFRQGEFAGAGAYRLGDYLYADKLYDAALAQFQLSAKEATSEEVRLSARYKEARCLDRLKRPEEAGKIYGELAEVADNNPYRDYARLAMAEAASQAGRKDDALALLEKLSTEPGAPALQAESTVKAALLAAELKQQEKALALFEKAMGMPEIGDWKSAAIAGFLQTAYGQGNYKKVISLTTSSFKDFPPESIPGPLLLLANAHRQLGNTKVARDLYSELLEKYPESTQAGEARFQRLISLYQLGDPNMLKEVDAFLEKATDPGQRNQASLLKAEGLFKEQKFAAAAEVYEGLQSADLPENLKSEALYKLAWCRAQTGDQSGAVKVYTEYLERYPKSAKIPSAIIQRGLAWQAEKEYGPALKDFDVVIEKYPEAKERELALQQKALILGQQKDFKTMAATFRQLLTEFPKSEAAGQANFWIGWSAFEEKDYKAAITSLEAARKLDPGPYGERSALRIMLSHYYLQDLAAVSREVDSAQGRGVPPEVVLWLARKKFDAGDYSAVEKYLSPMVKEGAAVDDGVWIELAESRLKLGKPAEAKSVAGKALEVAREPYARGRALLALADLARQEGRYDDAAGQVDEALLLQPEGKLNAEGRILLGEIASNRGDYPDAARWYMSVAVLTDDAVVTPKAMKKAVEAYQKANNPAEAEKVKQELQERYPNFTAAARPSGEAR